MIRVFRTLHRINFLTRSSEETLADCFEIFLTPLHRSLLRHSFTLTPIIIRVIHVCIGYEYIISQLLRQRRQRLSFLIHSTKSTYLYNNMYSH